MICDRNEDGDERMSGRYDEMVGLARAYCELIEGAERIDAEWLHKVAVLLPRLHGAVVALGSVVDEGGADDPLDGDLDARFELFAELRQLLGSWDGYWMEFDVAQDGQSMSGSLADDLTDIYCELKHGLRLLEQQPGQALEEWRSGYRVHWGQHLLDAERHLYTLKNRKQF